MYQRIYQNKKVLITGNTGFKGSWLSIWLLSLGADVYGLSNGIPTEPSIFEKLKLAQHITHFDQDVRDLEGVKRIISEVKPDFIFHLAAQPIVSISYQNPVDTFSTNVIGSCNILEALRVSQQACTVVMITSDKCYENVEWTWGYRENDRVGGKDPYSASKGAAEVAIRSFYHSFFKAEDSPVKMVTVRAGNVIGGGDWAASRIVPDSVQAWAKGEAVVIRSPQATRPWQHVLEPLSGYLRVGQLLHTNRKLSGESFNFGPKAEQTKTVLELLQELSLYWEFSSEQEKFQITENTSYHEAGLLKLNCDKALHTLQWLPTLDFVQTAQFTSEWYFNFYRHPEIDLMEFTTEQINTYCNIAKELKISWALD
ncbi:CDP-glucose 4,6-dehydratase [Rapidithrix thailandica]|uniref:CDP-glucose 4,6-dehydratase n=1 Tax=Rapidithrix thailandica TaxID=413964 RepID=A0AAW9SEP2_9BACT